MATLQRPSAGVDRAPVPVRDLAPRVVLALMLLATVVVAGRLVTPPRPVLDDVAADEFSAGRAMQDLEVIAAAPHPVGSPAQRKVRAYLVGEARALRLPVEVQRAASGAANVLVRLEGTAESDHDVLITGHYDSAPGTPGAGDNGIAVAAMLEAMRVLAASEPVDNDVVLLFTDGEEQGQTGIAAFVRDTRAAERVGTAFVFEALPKSGGTELRTTTPGDAWLVRELVDASLPIFTTSANNISDRDRIGNDFAALAPAGIVAGEFVTKGDRVRYHAASDVVADVDPGVVQDHGETMLALARHFGGLDLGAATTSDDDLVFFAVPADLLVAYPIWLAQVLGVAAALALVGVVALAQRGGLVRLRRVLVATGAVAALVLIGAVAARAAWQALLDLNPESATTVHHPDFEYATEAMYAIYATAGAAFLAACWALRRWLNGPELAIGALAWWMVGTLLVSFGEPLFSPVLLWPFVGGIAALAVLALVRSSWATAVLLGAAAVPTLVVTVPLLMLEALDVEDRTDVAVPLLLLVVGSLLGTLHWLAVGRRGVVTPVGAPSRSASPSPAAPGGRRRTSGGTSAGSHRR